LVALPAACQLAKYSNVRVVPETGDTIGVRLAFQVQAGKVVGQLDEFEGSDKPFSTQLSGEIHGTRIRAAGTNVHGPIRIQGKLDKKKISGVLTHCLTSCVDTPITLNKED